MAKDCGKKLGIKLSFQKTGGVCDGNKLAFFGCPNLDTLGVCGKGIHSQDETMYVDSLAERAALTASMLFQMAKGEINQ